MFTEDDVSVLRVIFCEFKLFDQVGASTSQSRNIQDYKDVPHMRDKCRFAAQGDGVIRQVQPNGRLVASPSSVSLMNETTKLFYVHSL